MANYLPPNIFHDRVSTVVQIGDIVRSDNYREFEEDVIPIIESCITANATSIEVTIFTIAWCIVGNKRTEPIAVTDERIIELLLGQLACFLHRPEGCKLNRGMSNIPLYIDTLQSGAEKLSQSISFQHGETVAVRSAHILCITVGDTKSPVIVIEDGDDLKKLNRKLTRMIFACKASSVHESIGEPNLLQLDPSIISLKCATSSQNDNATSSQDSPDRFLSSNQAGTHSPIPFDLIDFGFQFPQTILEDSEEVILYTPSHFM